MPLYIPVSGSEPSDFQPAIVTGNYYFSKSIVRGSTGALVAGELSAFPVWFSHTTTWTRIGFYVDTGSGSATEKVRLGLYANGADNLPGALIEDFGEASLQSTGEVELTISRELSANTLYWIAVITNDPGTTTQVNLTTGSNITVPSTGWAIGYSSFAEIGDAADGIMWYRTFSYAALPNPFGTPDGIQFSNIPYIWLRKV